VVTSGFLEGEVEPSKKYLQDIGAFFERRPRPLKYSNHRNLIEELAHSQNLTIFFYIFFSRTWIKMSPILVKIY